MTDELVGMINATPGWVKEMRIKILTASSDKVTCEWEVSQSTIGPTESSIAE